MVIELATVVKVARCGNGGQYSVNGGPYLGNFCLHGAFCRVL